MALLILSTLIHDSVVTFATPLFLSCQLRSNIEMATISAQCLFGYELWELSRANSELPASKHAHQRPDFTRVWVAITGTMHMSRNSLWVAGNGHD